MDNPDLIPGTITIPQGVTEIVPGTITIPHEGLTVPPGQPFLEVNKTPTPGPSPYDAKLLVSKAPPGTQSQLGWFVRLNYHAGGVDVSCEAPGFQNGQVGVTVESNRYLRIRAKNSDGKRSYDIELDFTVDTRRTVATLNLGIVTVSVLYADGDATVFTVPWVGSIETSRGTHYHNPYVDPKRPFVDPKRIG